MANKYLVIVESPAKAKTIKKFLGSRYKIEASMGHVRDLPKSQLGIDIENDFEPKYITIRGKGELLAKLRKEIKTADKVYLATDPDREGEAISWHLVAALGLEKEKFRRITFNEITKNAVKKSIAEAREIDMDLVNAQQARRVVDRIVGYLLSDLLWKKVKRGLSGGRVQSVALKLICDREEEINNFIPEEYWSIEADMKVSSKERFEAKYIGTENNKVELSNGKDAQEVVDYVKDKDFVVEEIKKGRRLKKPLPPFTTSTMQQEASKFLNFTAQKTMMIAQQLYEGVDIKGEGTVGLVSYIRTDSVRISDDAYEDIKSFIINSIGEEYLSEERNVYKSKNNAQDAHEAIRSTHSEYTPERVKDSLTKEQYKLYKLIWERTIACQMKPAEYESQTITLSAGKHLFRSTGTLLVYEGFLKVYSRIDDNQENGLLPVVNEGDVIKAENITPNQHFTQPPARFTDASLIKTLEEIGVGRPSTYAPTIATIIARNYVTKEKKFFYTTELGETVNGILTEYFKNIVNTDFTAAMETDLDSIEDGALQWKDIVKSFYPVFMEDLKNAEEKLDKVVIKDEETDIPCEKCGSNMVIKYGKFGKFLACPNFPACSNAKPLYEKAGVKCPLCDGEVLIKKTKKGRKYYGCENNPESCEFVSWNKPVDKKCPVCNSYMLEKGTKKITYLCSNDKCGYSEEGIEKE